DAEVQLQECVPGQVGGAERPVAAGRHRRRALEKSAVMRSVLIAVVVGVVLWSAGPAGAQVVQPPQRPNRPQLGGGPPPDPNRSRQELSFQGNIMGGYDDNLTGPAGDDALTSHPSGYVGFGDATARYFVGKSSNWFEMTGR